MRPWRTSGRHHRLCRHRCRRLPSSCLLLRRLSVSRICIVAMRCASPTRSSISSTASCECYVHASRWEFKHTVLRNRLASMHSCPGSMSRVYGTGQVKSGNADNDAED